jgi:transposase
MARKKVPMRQIREVLRLKYQNHLSLREIAGSCGLAVSTVGDYVQRAEAASITWPLPENLTEEELIKRLFGNAPETPPVPNQPLPDWLHIHQELRRKGVTLQLLWEEYRQVHPEGYSYSRFCELYQAWAQTLEPVLRQVHYPGEKMFVDWAGQTVPIYHADGSESAAQLFVAVLGFSNKTFAEAFPNQQLDSWIAGHNHAYHYLQGVARVTVPDYVPRHIIGLLFPTGLCAAPRRMVREWKESSG